jgi:hypothetical protein
MRTSLTGLTRSAIGDTENIGSTVDLRYGRRLKLVGLDVTAEGYIDNQMLLYQVLLKRLLFLD